MKEIQLTQGKVAIVDDEDFEILSQKKWRIDGKGYAMRCIIDASGKQTIIKRYSTSGFKGVTWHKKAGKWQAQIKINNKYKYIGLFTTKEEANSAYKQAACDLFGEFANFGVGCVILESV